MHFYEKTLFFSFYVGEYVVGDERIHENLNTIHLIHRKLFPLSYYLFQFRDGLNECKERMIYPFLLKNFFKVYTHFITIVVYPSLKC